MGYRSCRELGLGDEVKDDDSWGGKENKRHAKCYESDKKNDKRSTSAPAFTATIIAIGITVVVGGAIEWVEWI